MLFKEVMAYFAKDMFQNMKLFQWMFHFMFQFNRSCSHRSGIVESAGLLVHGLALFDIACQITISMLD